ncbi:MAG: hypothetical protein ACFFDY_00040 [Candidatus Thorarchaeota archaeon]
MTIENIWFNVNYKLPPKMDTYYTKDHFGTIQKCVFVNGEWRQDWAYNSIIIRKDIVAWKYINYE